MRTVFDIGKIFFIVHSTYNGYWFHNDSADIWIRNISNLFTVIARHIQYSYARTGWYKTNEIPFSKPKSQVRNSNKPIFLISIRILYSSFSKGTGYIYKYIPSTMHVWCCIPTRLLGIVSFKQYDFPPCNVILCISHVYLFCLIDQNQLHHW